ncbi:DUF3572 domain-containing protein [Nordella sp. HKS 07]|uniref:DUF3572 domain-containing protein n=1 Tax=Nordella sp. HKS 07 TaxID=2712222 RepID=UPI0013E10002|nr:DUF3572 domain-containing protein [Nordella sp. HKS 07]QIG51311.1 DUF3572 domain-containing protein [Nordella sp. HKS 07]
MRAPAINAGEAELIALKALGFLANEPERFSRFLALSGIELGDIRAAAQNPQFLAGLLNHLLQDESLLLTFTAEQELDPRLPALAAEALSRAR